MNGCGSEMSPKRSEADTLLLAASPSTVLATAFPAVDQVDSLNSSSDHTTCLAHPLFSFSLFHSLFLSTIFIMTKDKRPPRLHVDGAILGFKRALRTQNNSVSLIKIKGVDSTDDAEFYLGKKVAFITKASTPDKFGNKFRVTWGKVCRSHGSNGVVRCTFRRNLPPQAIGGRVRVMLYPSRV